MDNWTSLTLRHAFLHKHSDTKSMNKSKKMLKGAFTKINFFGYPLDVLRAVIPLFHFVFTSLQNQEGTALPF